MDRRASVKGHSATVMGLTFSPDGRTLASGSLDNTIRLWNLAIGQQVASLTGHSGPVGALAFFPDGNTLTSAGGDSTVRLRRTAPAATIERWRTRSSRKQGGAR